MGPNFSEIAKFSLTPCSVSQRGVWLCAVLVSTKSNSAQCLSAQSPPLHSDSYFYIYKSFIFWLCDVIVSEESDSAQFSQRVVIYFRNMYSGKKNLSAKPC